MNFIPELSMEDPNLVNSLTKHYDELECHIDNNDIPRLQYKLDYLVHFLLENGKQMDRYPALTNQLDNFIIIFRNLLRNTIITSQVTQSIPYSLKLLLLRLIENRSSKWSPKEDVQQYYLNKLPFVDNFVVNNNSNNNNNNNNRNKQARRRNTLRASKSAGDVSNINILNNNNTFNKTMKKSQFEGDILIKNNESGRVMGVKGRRVHMIEQLSNTVISFQKVPPTSQNRLVHITGQSPESIEIAKSIILTTIRDNVSPLNDDFFTSGDSLGQTSERTPDSVWSIDSSRHVTPAPEYRSNILVRNETITLLTDTPQIGKYLEEFLVKYDFDSFIELRSKTAKKSVLIYDRETLLSLQPLATPISGLDLDIEFIRNSDTS